MHVELQLILLLLVGLFRSIRCDLRVVHTVISQPLHEEVRTLQSAHLESSNEWATWAVVVCELSILLGIQICARSSVRKLHRSFTIPVLVVTLDNPVVFFIGFTLAAEAGDLLAPGNWCLVTRMRVQLDVCKSVRKSDDVAAAERGAIGAGGRSMAFVDLPIRVAISFVRSCGNRLLSGSRG